MSEPPERTIGILTVHGIGAQEHGDLARSLADGLVGRTGGRRLQEDGCSVSIACPGARLRIYDVHWADLLKGEKVHGSFSWADFMSLAWFPWLNLRHGLYGAQGIRWWEALLWTPILMIVGVGLGPVAAAAALFRAGAGAVAARGEADLHRSAVDPPPEGLSRFVALARSRAEVGREVSQRPSILDRLLDEFAGDVTNYVASASHGAGSGETNGVDSLSDTLDAAYPGILDTIYTTAARALDECDEVHVVAHSLGTVATFHALAGFRAREVGLDPELHRDTVDRLRRLYTIGSPLAKIRFLWPTLVPRDGLLRTRPLPWANFVSRMDPVAGRLKRRYPQWGEVEDRMMLGGGVLRAHTLYARSPAFLDRLIRDLLGDVPLQRPGWGARTVSGLFLVGESLAAPVGFGSILVLGMAALVSLPLGLAWTASALVGLVAPAAGKVVLWTVGGLLAGPMLITAAVQFPRAAAVRHRRWREGR